MSQVMIKKMILMKYSVISEIWSSKNLRELISYDLSFSNCNANKGFKNEKANWFKQPMKVLNSYEMLNNVESLKKGFYLTKPRKK
jgi:hypothetical protein